MKINSLTLVALWIVPLVSGEEDSKMISLKIVQAPALSRFTPLQRKVLTPKMSPCNLNAPPHLLLLNGTCYKFKHDNYFYNLCPFHNVTQKEDTNRITGFHGIVGIWSDWIIENGTFTGMVYSKGERCGIVDRQAKVFFNCSTVANLTNITEPKTCHYEMIFHTPLACFKGAMQIFHLLSSEVMTKWETLEKEFYGGEWTLKGFNKKQLELLRQAQLAPPEVSKKTTDNVTRSPFAVHDTCQKEKDELLKEVTELRSEVARLRNLLVQEQNRTVSANTTINSTLPTLNTNTSTVNINS